MRDDFFNVLEQTIAFMSDTETNLDPEMKIRLALGFYAHLASASNFYIIPYNLLAIAQDRPVDISGATLSQHCLSLLPANCLIEMASQLDDHTFAESLEDLFHFGLVHAYQTGRYQINKEGIVMCGIDADSNHLMSFEQFELQLERAINFFVLLKKQVDKQINLYQIEKQVKGTLYPGGDIKTWRIKYTPSKKMFSILGLATKEMVETLN